VGGLHIPCSHNVEDAMKLLASYEPDLIVLNVLLTNTNLIDCSRNARSYANALIVFMSSGEDDEVKISALSDDADCVSKPFSPGVLMAKIKAQLRRVSRGRREQLLELPSLTLDYNAESVIR
jgi:DNA-binding response OmpR family regulator